MLKNKAYTNNILTKKFKILKYICGGKSIDTAAQHILIDEMPKMMALMLWHRKRD